MRRYSWLLGLILINIIVGFIIGIIQLPSTSNQPVGVGTKAPVVSPKATAPVKSTTPAKAKAPAKSTAPPRSIVPAKATVPSALVTVIEEPGTDAAFIADVQEAVNDFNAMLSEKIGLALTRNARLYICPTQEKYAYILEHELKQDHATAEEHARLSSGYSGGRVQTVAINGSNRLMKSKHKRAFITAHELFHQVQYQVAGSTTKDNIYWLMEGSADLVGALASERLGGQSIDQWKEERVKVLRRNSHVSVQKAFHIDRDEWWRLVEQKQYPYEVADLMVLLLVQRSGYEAIGEYFRLLGKSVDAKTAFRRVFGINESQFLEEFEGKFPGI